MTRLPRALVVLLFAGCVPAADPPPPVTAGVRAEAGPLLEATGSSVSAPVRTAPAAGSDWPTFLGPNQDNVSTETGIIAPWPKAGLGKVWDCPLGVGYPPPVIADGRLFHF